MTLPLKKYRKGSIGTELPGSDPPDRTTHQPSADKILPSFSQGELLPPLLLLAVASRGDEARRGGGGRRAERRSHGGGAHAAAGGGAVIMRARRCGAGTGGRGWPLPLRAGRRIPAGAGSSALGPRQRTPGRRSWLRWRLAPSSWSGPRQVAAGRSGWWSGAPSCRPAGLAPVPGWVLWLGEETARADPLAGLGAGP